MNQKLKKVNANFFQSRIKPWLFFSLFIFIIPFIILTSWVGLIFWFPSLIICVLIVLALHWMFYRFLNRSFEGMLLKGYDPWHLRPLLDKYTPKKQWIVSSHSIPFIFSFDFYHIKKIILSQALLIHLKKNEIENLIKYHKYYFKQGWARFFTQFCFVLFIFLFPCQYFIFFLKKLKGPAHIFEKIIQYVFFTPLYPLTSFFYYRLDQKINKELNIYPELIWKLQNYLDTSSLDNPILLSPLYGVNPRPGPQPPIEKRIKKLTKSFSIS